MADRRYVGVDLGGTSFKIAVSDAEGRILGERRAPSRSEEGHEAVLARIVGEAKAALDEAGVEKADAAGVGLPGTLDMRAGIVRYLANFPGHWRDVDARTPLEEALGIPVHILNDVRAATLGEFKFGRGRELGARSMILLALGTGIGGGVVIDGKLRLGALGSAGEIGHGIVEPGGPPCGCGARGCLETFASGPALAAEGVRLMWTGQAPRLRDLVEGDANRVDPKAMGEAARAGDSLVRMAIERAGRYLALSISNLIVALHPELVVIGGGVAGLGDLLMDPIRAGVLENVRMFPADDVRIETSSLGDRAGVMGAIAWAMQGGMTEEA
ncbi:ROK family protein [Candidatus Sumerlaeota bacterium]|nr:ROK family protein [Candidatus Sumerlaeota bacterium]